MRVLHVSPSFPPLRCGIADYVAHTARQLADVGILVDVITSNDPDIRRSSNGSVTSRVCVLPVIEHWDWRMWSPLVRAIRRINPDVVHVHYQQLLYDTDPAILLLPLILRSFGRRHPVVTTMHDVAFPARVQRSRVARNLLMDGLLRGSSHLLVGNADNKRYVERRHLKTPVEVLPVFSSIPVVPLPPGGRDAMLRQLAIPPQAQMVVYFGLIRRGKGIEHLLSVIAALHRNDRDAHLLLIGDTGSIDAEDSANYQRYLRDQQTRLAIDEFVHWTGHSSESAVSHYLQCADVVVLPFEEGASTSRTSLMAALEHGAPLVTTQSPLTPSNFRQGENVMLVPAPAEPASLLASVAAVLSDAALRRRLAAGARELAHEFAPPSVTNRLLDIYESVTRA